MRLRPRANVVAVVLASVATGCGLIVGDVHGHYVFETDAGQVGHPKDGGADTDVRDTGLRDTGIVDGVTPPADGADAGCSSAYETVVRADNPTAYFKLAETSLPESLACKNEVSGSTIFCTYASSGISFDKPGVESCARAIHFDTNQASISLTGGLDFPGNTAFTLEAWIEIDQLDSSAPYGIDAAYPYNVLLGYDFLGNAPINGGYWIFMFDNNAQGGPGPRTEMYADGSLSDYAWYHMVPTANTFFSLVLTHDVTTNSDNLYINGTPTGDEFVEPNKTGNRPATGKPFLWTGFIGSLEDVAVYNTTLTADQVAAHHAARFQ